MSTKTFKDLGNIKIAESIQRWTMNFTDIVANSNKYYNLELVKDTNGNFYLYTNYGRLGGTPAKEYRSFSSETSARSEAEKIVKSKAKKGYQEIKLVQASVGSDAGKSKIEASQVSIESLEKAGIKVEEDSGFKSKLHSSVQSLISTWFGITSQFLEANLDTKKCPLGQLSIEQITKAKDILEESIKIVHGSKDITELNKLTNNYYSNIPHNFGYGRINADVLRLDSDDKIQKAFDILDVFTDAKNAEKVIVKKSNVDDKYDTLNADFEYIERANPIWDWVDSLIQKTRAPNHHFLGNIKVHNIFAVSRKNENEIFLSNAQEIAKQCGVKNHELPEGYKPLITNRPDVPNELAELYKNANILPLFHGTRRANMIGITTKGFLIRPSGVVHAGSMYGDAIYLGKSSKSINYCDVKGSYWAQGDNKTAYLFIADAALGNQKIANGSYMHTLKNISPNHSVWAKGGRSGVINDEWMIYNPAGKNQQHRIRYIVEFETLAR